MFSLVVAADGKRGIGQDGAIPWKLKGDLRFFRELTTCPDRQLVHARYRLDTGHRDKRVFAWDRLAVGLGPAARLPEPTAEARNAVLMGRKTWDSLPDAFRPLPLRVNGVLSRRPPEAAGNHRVWASLDQAAVDLEGDASVRNVYVIGGGEIYAQALRHPACARIYLTSLDAEFPCDTFLPEFGPEFREIARSPSLEEGGIVYRFLLLEKT